MLPFDSISPSTVERIKSICLVESLLYKEKIKLIDTLPKNIETLKTVRDHVSLSSPGRHTMIEFANGETEHE